MTPDSSTLNRTCLGGWRILWSRQRNLYKFVLIYNFECVVFDISFSRLLNNLISRRPSLIRHTILTLWCRSSLSISGTFYLMLKLLELLAHTYRGSWFLMRPLNTIPLLIHKNILPDTLPLLNFWIFVVIVNRGVSAGLLEGLLRKMLLVILNFSFIESLILSFLWALISLLGYTYFVGHV